MQPRNQPLLTPTAETAGTVQFRYPLRKDVTADVTLSGKSLTAKDLETLRRHLELAKETWEEEGKSQPV